VAIKKIRVSSPTLLKYLHREISILRQLGDNTFTTQIMDLVILDEDIFDTLYIIMELCQHSFKSMFDAPSDGFNM